MIIVEELTASDYKKVKLASSRIDPSASLAPQVSYYCPNCGRDFEKLTSNKSADCQCGLSALLQGNLLTCHIDEKDLVKK